MVSYARNCEATGRTYSFTVLDDTESMAIRAATRDWLHSFSSKFNVQVSYADVMTKARFSDELERLGISRPILDFALCGCPATNISPGRNRNAALLHFANDRFLCSDDDAFCRPTKFSSGDQSLGVLKRDSLSLDTHFFSTRREAFRAAPEEECDVLGAHDALLGRQFEELNWAPGSLDYLRIALGRQDHSARSAHNGRVSVTVSGVVGDSGVPNILGFLIAPDLILERFISRMQDEGTPRISRNVVRGVCRPSVTPLGLVFTTTGTGFDNQTLLPPFSPSAGGEDTLFGVLLSLCDPSAFTAHVPVGLAHDPSTERFYSAPQIAPNLMRILMELANTSLIGPEHDTAKRMRVVGQTLQNIADSTFSDFCNVIAEVARKVISSWTACCLQYLSFNEQKYDKWAVAMKEWLADLRLSMDEGRFLGPNDFKNGYSDEERLRLMQSYIRNYGQLLREWPDIIEVSRSLRGSGHRIAPELGHT